MYSAVNKCEVEKIIFFIILIYIIIGSQIHLCNLNHSFEITLFFKLIYIIISSHIHLRNLNHLFEITSFFFFN